jgi:hypothetical protein
VKHASNGQAAALLDGSISMKTRRNVSCEGMPFGGAKKVLSHACLLRPWSSMSSQLSAQAITARTAIARMSTSRCSIYQAQRGSSSPVKHAAKPSTMPLVPRCAERETASTIVNQ